MNDLIKTLLPTTSRFENRAIRKSWKPSRERGTVLSRRDIFLRVEKYERDLKRWEFMDEESKRQSQRIDTMNDKYLTGRKNKGGAAYNILSLNYEQSPEGEFLKERDNDSKVRALMRSKNIDVRGNCGHNVMTG